MRRTPAAAELPSVAGRPGSDFNGSAAPDAFWPLWRAAARNASAAGKARAPAPLGWLLLALMTKRVGVTLRLQRFNGIVRSSSGPGAVHDLGDRALNVGFASFLTIADYNVPNLLSARLNSGARFLVLYIIKDGSFI